MCRFSKVYIMLKNYLTGNLFQYISLLHEYEFKKFPKVN